MRNKEPKSQKARSLFIPIIALIISAVALFQSCEANRLSRATNDVSAHTYLWVEPTKVSLRNDRVVEMLKMDNLPVDGNRYLIALRNLMFLFSVEIKNTGPHAANDVKLYFELVYRPMDQRIKEKLPLSGVKPIGSIAPGQTVINEDAIGLGGPNNPPVDPEIDKAFKDMFNKGVMDADITVYVTYRDANNNLMSSGKYLGTISNGGKILERRANGNMIGYKGYLNDVK